MQSKMKLLIGASLLAAMAWTMGTPATAADEKINLKVVGSWGNLNNWLKIEKPFWTEQLKAASGGKVTADATPMTEIGLKGFEIMRLLQQGVFHVGHGVISYLSDDPVAEGIDLAGVMQDWTVARKVTDAYRDTLAESFNKSYDAKLLGIYPFHSHMIYCRKPVTSIESLKGLKIRSYSKSLSDLISGLGATPVTVAYGEVAPALQLGTVDCAVSGNFSAYTSGWQEVTSHLYKLRLGFALSFVAINNATWAKLDEKTRAFLVDGVRTKLEQPAWDLMSTEDARGVACLTGNGECPDGKPGKLVEVDLSASDKAALKAAVEKSVLDTYGKRCGAACVKRWNETVGKAAGVTIKN